MKPMALFILLCTNFTFPCFAITPMGTSTADFLITRNQLRSNALTYPIYYWVDAPNFPKTQDTLHIKLDSISLFEKTDPKARGGQCSGKERTLDLNKNSYYTSVMHIGGKPADTQIGTLKLIANSLSKVAQKLGVTLGKGHMTCAEIHFNYRNGDNTKIRKIRDKVITYSANSGATTKKIENAPIILGNIQTKATVITSANIRSNHLYLNKKAVIQFESGGKPIKRIIFKAGSLQKITVHNVGYGTLSALKFTCPDAFSRDFSYSCTQSLLSGKTCTISYRGRQNTPVGTGRLFINGDNGTQYHWLIAFTIQKPGQVQCWGRNTYGQLGNDSLKTHITPQNVAGLSPNTTRISAGMNDVCALNNHKVYCWGRNNDGQLGTGDKTNRKVPTPVVDLPSEVTEITTGTDHSCALLTDGSVKCWGNNSNGELGDGTTKSHTTPVNVLGLNAKVIQIAAKGHTTCALLETGGVQCWGANDYGQLGNGTKTNSDKPVSVSGLTAHVIGIYAGGYHNCALLDNGIAKCWGANDYGQLGIGSLKQKFSTIPIAIAASAKHIDKLVAGQHDTCALLFDETLQCWGEGTDGQIGNNKKNKMNPSPLPVLNINDVTDLTSGDYHNCAVLNTGQEYCWGWNNEGQIGDGTTKNNILKPSLVNAITHGIALTAGHAHSCSLVSP